MKAAKEAGLVRSEGKEYVVKDADGEAPPPGLQGGGGVCRLTCAFACNTRATVMLFRFNV